MLYWCGEAGLYTFEEPAGYIVGFDSPFERPDDAVIKAPAKSGRQVRIVLRISYGQTGIHKIKIKALGCGSHEHFRKRSDLPHLDRQPWPEQVAIKASIDSGRQTSSRRNDAGTECDWVRAIATGKISNRSNPADHLYLT